MHEHITNWLGLVGDGLGGERSGVEEGGRSIRRDKGGRVGWRIGGVYVNSHRF